MFLRFIQSFFYYFLITITIYHRVAIDLPGFPTLSGMWYGKTVLESILRLAQPIL